jgi:hypothetical protein
MMDYFLASLNSMNPLFRKKHISYIIFWIGIYHCSAQESQTRKGFILPDGGTTTFIENPEPIRHQESSRSTYDKTGFRLITKTNGQVKLTKVKRCLLQHQNQIFFQHCNGKILNQHDTVTLYLESLFKNIYVCAINQNKQLDSFSSKIIIRAVVRDLNQKPASVFINVQHPELMALPQGGDPENKYAPIHPKSEVAIFSFFEIEDEKGHKFQYKPGDFIVVGGNSMDYIWNHKE